MKEQRWRLIAGWLWILFLSYGLTALLILGTSFLMYHLKGSGPLWKGSVYVVNLLACALGGFLAGRQMVTKRLWWGMVFSLSYVATMIVLSLAWGNGGLPQWQSVLPVLGLCMAGGALGAVLS